MSKGLDYLDFSANHFVHRDWIFTNKTHIESIRFSTDYYTHQTLKYRFLQGWSFLTGTKKQSMIFKMSFKERIFMFFYCLKRDKNLPDGSLDEGSIITFWGETGEYLQFVQPSVGDLLVKFLRDQPENPHAIKITEELDRIYELFKKVEE